MNNYPNSSFNNSFPNLFSSNGNNNNNNNTNDNIFNKCLGFNDYSKKSTLKANFIDIDEISKSSDDDFYYMIPEKCDVTY